MTIPPNASWRVTDRLAGDSQGAFAFNNLAEHVGDDPAAVASNRARLARSLGVATVVFARASHSNGVALVTAGVPDVPGADALITDRAGLAVAAMGADCVMVGLTAGDWVAAIHCGWRGLVTGVVPTTLRELRGHGADLGSASAHLGPSICGACYAVDAQRAAAVRGVCPEAVVESSGGFGVDVRTGVLAQLAEAGIAATADPRCTAEDPDLYSYRRDGRTGRQALAIVRGAA